MQKMSKKAETICLSLLIEDKIFLETLLGKVLSIFLFDKYK